jgi:hypothetical protein
MSSAPYSFIVSGLFRCIFAIPFAILLALEPFYKKKSSSKFLVPASDANEDWLCSSYL